MIEIRPAFIVPYTCQYASRDAVRAYVSGDLAIESDPLWAEYGASSPAEYAHWARRSCGVVCVKMVVEALTGAAPQTVMDWVKKGLAIDGYLTETRPDRPGERIEKGWLHDALVKLISDSGLWAERRSEVGMADMVEAVRSGHLFIASVSSQLGEEQEPITRSSGHLVIVVGVDLSDTGNVAGVIIHNPSGRTRALQEGARIPVDRFTEAFSGRGILTGRRQIPPRALPPQR